VYYYLTIYNEPYAQPEEPADVHVEGILRGMHLVSEGFSANSARNFKGPKSGG
jgi:pyruvate dehydrogenase E1 component